MLSPGKLAQYIGFTEEEVRKLAESYHQEFEKVKRWYDQTKKTAFVPNEEIRQELITAVNCPYFTCGNQL